MMTTQRDGKIGVLFHEYARAITELKQVLNTLRPGELECIVDTSTQNPNCVSIQTILAHLVACGHMYRVYVEQHRGLDREFVKTQRLDSAEAYGSALDEMFVQTQQVFATIDNSEVDEYDPEKKIHVYWGQLYDYEQLLEHAIVHILRHRFQIENFILKIRSAVV